MDTKKRDTLLQRIRLVPYRQWRESGDRDVIHLSSGRHEFSATSCGYTYVVSARGWWYHSGELHEEDFHLLVRDRDHMCVFEYPSLYSDVTVANIYYHILRTFVLAEEKREQKKRARLEVARKRFERDLEERVS